MILKFAYLYNLNCFTCMISGGLFVIIYLIREDNWVLNSWFSICLQILVKNPWQLNSNSNVKCGYLLNVLVIIK